MTVLAVAAMSWVGPRALAGDDPGTPSFDQRIRTYVVQPGDSIWGIAVRFSRPGSDPRQMVDAITTASGTTALIQPGQVLRIPVPS